MGKTKWIDVGNARIGHGDCLQFLVDMDDGSVDAVYTDPPYNSGGTQSVRTKPPSEKYSNSSASAYPDFTGDNKD